MKGSLVLALCALLALAFVSCGKKKEAASKTGAPATAPDIVEAIAQDGRLSTFSTALATAGLDETLKGEGPFTVFAPTDSAFAKLPPGTIESLYQEVPTLKKLVSLHIAPGKLMAEDVKAPRGLETLGGEAIPLAPARDGRLTIGGATVVLADVPARNGVIHVIDRVLLPRAEP